MMNNENTALLPNKESEINKYLKDQKNRNELEEDVPEEHLFSWILAVSCFAIWLDYALFSCYVSIMPVYMPDNESFEVYFIFGLKCAIQMVLTIPYGLLVDKYGPRRPFQCSFFILLIASIVLAVHASPTTLLIARIIQGLGSAGILVSALAFCDLQYKLKDNLDTSTGLIMACLGLGIFTGPTISSVLMESISITAPFYFFLICAVALFLSSMVIKYPLGSYGEVVPDPSGGSIQAYGSRSRVDLFAEHIEVCSPDPQKSMDAFLGWKIMFPIIVFFIGDAQWGMLESQFSYFDIEYLGIAPKASGYIFSSIFISYTIACWAAGYFNLRFWSFAGALVLYGFSLMFLCSVLSITYQIIMCLLVGWALGSIETVILNVIHDQLKIQDIEHRRGYAFSLVDIAINAGYFGGAMITGWMQTSKVDFATQMFWSSWIEFLCAFILVLLFWNQMFVKKVDL